MLSFRKKIIFGDIVLFLMLIVLILPLLGKTVSNIAKKSLQDTVENIITEAQGEKNINDLIKWFKEKEKFNFYRITLFDAQGKSIYDSHEDFSDLKMAKEIEEAMKKGYGYNERTSKTFGQDFAFIAKSFIFQGQSFVVRAAFPLKQIRELREDLEFGFLIFAIVLLLVYVIMAYVLVHRVSQPIRNIIKTIQPYQNRETEKLPSIDIDKMMTNTQEFQQLALTLNSLSGRIRKQIDSLTSQRNENEAILQSLMEGVLGVNSENIVTYVNDVACNMLGISKDELLGKDFHSIDKKGTLLKLCRKQLLLCQKEDNPIKETIILDEGKKIYLDVIASFNLKRRGAILVLQDKTSDYRMIQMGKDFIANASHELRTPITVIQGFAETLLDHPNISPDMLKNVAEKIFHTSNKLNDLVNALLMLSDIENMTPSRLISCNVEDIVDNCVNMMMQAHDGAEIIFHRLSDNHVILADPSLLELAISNLIDNGIKYSQKSPKIDISLEEDGKNICLLVQDNGIGIPQEDRERIFERFYRVDKARSSKIRGLGLGLSIVKTIIDKHGGKISVTSSDQGSCFKIIIPIVV